MEKTYQVICHSIFKLNNDIWSKMSNLKVKSVYLSLYIYIYIYIYILKLQWNWYKELKLNFFLFSH